MFVFTEPTAALSVSIKPTGDVSVSTEPIGAKSVSTKSTGAVSVSSKPTGALSVCTEPTGAVSSKPTGAVSSKPTGAVVVVVYSPVSMCRAPSAYYPRPPAGNPSVYPVDLQTWRIQSILSTYSYFTLLTDTCIDPCT